MAGFLLPAKRCLLPNPRDGFVVRLRAAVA